MTNRKNSSTRIRSAVKARSTPIASSAAVPTCQQCGCALEQPLRGRPRTFCSSACRLRAFRARDTEPQITIPRALLDELAAVLSDYGDRATKTLVRVLAQHDARRAHKLARALRTARRK